ncbi:MAG TPA: bifunctional glutamate N-acetyltransferase/amino-acid acetyltransferase ArgJ [Caulobacteraceae bacterium]|nr:bifunctional glutamate N-acetyltransferase/amino-acid acetyltransferase ArgJ [Caulobacteraceae bacterium]
MTAAPIPAAPGKPGLAVSPLAVAFPAIGTVGGVELATARAGFYTHAREDLVVMRFAPGTTCAGVFTRHGVGSAPVDWCRQALAATGGEDMRAVVINAGCANSFTGKPGFEASRRSAAAVAALADCGPDQVMVASTGVIGVLLDAGKIEARTGEIAATLAPGRWAQAAAGIMTTDTFPKGAVASCEIGGVPVRIAGIAKGSGMIAPDMATMLAFVATDAALSPKVVQALLTPAIVRTFNAVTVDGDRSTNDTCLVFATGASGAPRIDDATDPRLERFRVALVSVLMDLAQQLVRDGEGARKFVKVTVSGATSEASARKMARTICESPLVKTAFAGEDANWGRITMAVGRADEPMDRDRLSIRFGELWAARDGTVSPDYDEAAMSAYMKRPELEVAVDVGVGAASATMWTCDLTHGYISINGDYRS